VFGMEKSDEAVIFKAMQASGRSDRRRQSVRSVLIVIGMVVFAVGYCILRTN